MGKARAKKKLEQRMAPGSLEPSGAEPPASEARARDDANPEEFVNIFGGGPDDFTTPVGLAYHALGAVIFCTRLALVCLHSYTLNATRTDRLMQHWAAHPGLFASFCFARMLAMGSLALSMHPVARRHFSLTVDLAVASRERRPCRQLWRVVVVVQPGGAHQLH